MPCIVGEPFAETPGKTRLYSVDGKVRNIPHIKASERGYALLSFLRHEKRYSRGQNAEVLRKYHGRNAEQVRKYHTFHAEMAEQYYRVVVRADGL